VKKVLNTNSNNSLNLCSWMMKKSMMKMSLMRMMRMRMMIRERKKRIMRWSS
jgi:hypothetical protein